MDIKAKIHKTTWKAICYIAFLVTVCAVLLKSSYAEAPARIISLSPSTTEILFAAGLGDHVVGVTTFCDYPAEAKAKPKIGGMSTPSLEAVVSLQPDVVVMTTDGNSREFAHKLASLHIETHVFRSLTLDQLSDGIRQMGEALKEPERFESLAIKVEQAVEDFSRRETAKGRKILYIVWPEPLIVAGARTAADDAIRLLGGTNIARKARGRYPKFSLEAILRQSPDVIFIGEGSGMKEVSRGLLRRLEALPAVRQKRVFYVSDRLYRLGPRVIEGIEELSRHLEEISDSSE